MKKIFILFLSFCCLYSCTVSNNIPSKTTTSANSSSDVKSNSAKAQLVLDKSLKESNDEVEVPSAAIYADKMNVLYIGVDNPISVVATGVSFDDLVISVSGDAEGKLTKRGPGKYNLTVSKRPSRGQFCIVDIKIKSTGKTIAQMPFRVKRVPNPIAKLVNGKTDGNIKAGEMKTMTGIIAVLENFDFDARCKIQGFTLNYIAKGKPPVEIKGQGGEFAAEVLEAVQSAKAGDAYLFTNVKGSCPGDTAGRKLNALAFMIR